LKSNVLNFKKTNFKKDRNDFREKEKRTIS
jgi:hypothetical protein